VNTPTQRQIIPTLIDGPKILVLDELKKTEREVLLYLHDIIKKNDNVCPALRLTQICLDLKVSYPVVCKGFNTFVNYGWIKKLKQNMGRESFVKFEIESETLLIIKKYLSGAQMDDGAFVEEMSHEFKVTIPDSLAAIGFKINVVSQLKREGFQMKLVQDSLDAFAFDLIKNTDYLRKINSPVAYFITVFKKNDGYFSIHGYLSDEDKMIEETIKAKQRFLDTKEQRTKDLFELSFKDWLGKQTENDLLRLAPLIDGGTPLGLIHLNDLKSVFKETVFRS
jgi:hypothetical protein